MKLLLTSILITSSIFSSAQINRDSLLIILLDETRDAVVRLKAFRQICTNNFIYENPERLIELTKMGIELAEEKQLMAEKAFGSYCMGMAHHYIGEVEDAILFQNQSIEISQQLKDTTMMTRALNNLGNVYLSQSDYVSAINYYLRSQKLVEEKGNEKGLADCKENIGLVFFDLKYDEKALEYFNEALSIYEKIGDEKSPASTLINIGTVYQFQEEHDKALNYYEQGLGLKKKHNIKYGVGTCYSNIGLIYRAKGEEEKALEYFNLSMQLHRKSNYKKGIARNFIDIGDWYFSISKDSSLAYASEALTLAQQSNYSEEIVDAAELLSKIHESLGNYEEAMKMQTLFRDLRDSIYDVKIKQAVLKSEFKYDHEEEIEDFEKEIKDHEIWNRKLTILFFVAFSLVIFSFGLYILNKKRQNLAQRKELLQQIESLKKKLLTQSVAAPVEDKKILTLNKAKIEKAINNRLGESSWMILNLIFNDPSISNKEIAEKVSLSVEGVSSSLRRMYQAFEISSSSNKKISLIMKATRLSFED